MPPIAVVVLKAAAVAALTAIAEHLMDGNN